MDPIKHGARIFKNVANQFEGKTIIDKKDIRNFFEALLSRTKGWVILDFLDLSNWDKIEAFSLDEKCGLLTLVWHDYRGVKETPEENEIRKMVFPASLYSLGIYAKSIVPISGETGAIFLINGYSKSVKEIRNAYSKGAEEIRVSDNSFFEKRVIRKVGRDFEVTDVHCTPLFSLAIVPKNCGISGGDSQNLLYGYNLQSALRRISNVVKAFDRVDPNDEDTICEKVNTARRTLELVLKIECCYRELEIKENYSQVLLGLLIATVKKTKDDSMKVLLSKMAELLNEFSHDSGMPVDINKAKLAATLVFAYTKLFEYEISVRAAF
jgi:hypothetical protein